MRTIHSLVLVAIFLANCAFAATEHVLYNFATQQNDVFPGTTLAMDSQGVLYGTREHSGKTFGYVYQLTPSGGTWIQKHIYNFKGGNDGGYPFSGLTFDNAGHLFGITGGDGANVRTTIFELVRGPKRWTESVLYRFTNGPDGSASFAGLSLDASGNIYGTTVDGGPNNKGTVFRLSKVGGVWSKTILYAFSGGSDGGLPFGGITIDSAGNLYGTADQGGDFDSGVAFKLTQAGNSWTESVLHSFNLNTSDGAFPWAGLSLDANGNLFGTTTWGGLFPCIRDSGAGCGTVFQLSPSQNGWNYSVIYRFNTQNDGEFPMGNLTVDNSGNLYGVTQYSWSGVGTVYKLTNNGGVWSEGILYEFTGSTDGGYPGGGLSLDPSGNLYGVTFGGGTHKRGAVFQLTP